MAIHGNSLFCLLLLLWMQVDSLVHRLRCRTTRWRHVVELWDESSSDVTSDDSLRLGSNLTPLQPSELNATFAKGKLFNAIREAGTRSQGLELLLLHDHVALTDADCKTVLAGVVYSKAEHLLPQFIEFFRKQGKLTSELVYMGIRTAFRRRVSNITFANTFIECILDD